MAVLALLTARPMTGFDVMRQFDSSVGFLWSAPHTQIYPELRKLEQSGLIAGTDVPRGQKGTKRIYEITESGIDQLRSMMDDIEEPRRERDPYRLKAAYLEFADPEKARVQLTTHLEFFQAAEILYKQQQELLLARKVPLLQDRLAHVPVDQQEAVVQFKVFAYAGLVRRARGEVEWAKEGLELIDRLARTQSDSDSVAEAVASKCEQAPAGAQ